MALLGKFFLNNIRIYFFMPFRCSFVHMKIIQRVLSAQCVELKKTKVTFKI